MHMHHLAIRVKNLDESIRFYETLAGLSVRRRFAESGAELAYLTSGEGATEVELIAIPGETGTFEGKGFFVCFATDQLDAAHKTAVEAGFQPSDIRQPDENTRYFYAYDPNGVSVQLREYL